MAPDINTLSSGSPSIPHSPVMAHSRPRRISVAGADNNQNGPPSPRSPSLLSLQAAATINASLHHSPNSASPARTGLERRRSSLMTNFAINDPALPAAGEMQSSSNSSPRFGRRSIALSGPVDPHHNRQPSLGELHQKLEEEQEAQANRLLHMIRLQQDQLDTLQAQQQHPADPSPTSETPGPASSHAQPHLSERPGSRSGSIAGLPHGHGIFNRPTSLSRQSSSRVSNTGTSSHTGSPATHPSNGSLGPLTEDFLLGGTRDESAFYQAETQMLTRENQMLKQRIRELERQVSELNGPPGLHASSGATVSHNSPLANSPATFANDATTVPES